MLFRRWSSGCGRPASMARRVGRQVAPVVVAAVADTLSVDEQLAPVAVKLLRRRSGQQFRLVAAWHESRRYAPGCQVKAVPSGVRVNATGFRLSQPGLTAASSSTELTPGPDEGTACQRRYTRPSRLLSPWQIRRPGSWRRPCCRCCALELRQLTRKARSPGSGSSTAPQVVRTGTSGSLAPGAPARRVQTQAGVQHAVVDRSR